MKRIVRVGTVEQQDELRRENMGRMSPDERLAMLLQWRDDCFPDCGPIRREVTARKISWLTYRSSPKT